MVINYLNSPVFLIKDSTAFAELLMTGIPYLLMLLMHWMLLLLKPFGQILD